jgi:hypothetical protein
MLSEISQTQKKIPHQLDLAVHVNNLTTLEARRHESDATWLHSQDG